MFDYRQGIGPVFGPALDACSLLSSRVKDVGLPPGPSSSPQFGLGFVRQRRRFYSRAHRGWSRSREIFGTCGWAAGWGYPACGAAWRIRAGYPVCGAAFGVRAGLRRGWMVAGCP